MLTANALAFRQIGARNSENGRPQTNSLRYRNSLIGRIDPQQLSPQAGGAYDLPEHFQW
ncbi:hypothetical protein GCM10009113_04060 [Marinobacter szutsaonensis]